MNPSKQSAGPKAAAKQCSAPAVASLMPAPVARRLSNFGLWHALQAKLTINPLVQASPIAGRAVQRRAASDPRLPADKVEALDFAAESKREIDAAVPLASAAEPLLRNAHDFIAQQGLRLLALTPRHDSVVEPGWIRFFAGQVNYSDSVKLPEDATYHIDATRRAVSIRARQHDDVNTLLDGLQIKERIVQAVREVAHTSAARRGAPGQFDNYSARFNVLWDAAEFAGLSTNFDQKLDSKGPQTEKSRAIFQYLIENTPGLRDAYNADHGIRERIDLYVAPASFNPLISPRLQKLREVFFGERMPISNAAFPRFRRALVAAAKDLDPTDRETVVDKSPAWQRLISAHAGTDEQRADIRTVIRTRPVTPAPPITPAPAPAGARHFVTPQTIFVDGITIDGPTAPVVANKRRAQVALTPRSKVPNPGVAIDSRITVTPANHVAGKNVSPDSRWADGANAGTPFSPEIINNSTVTMTAHLDLVNEPNGLAPAAPIPDFTFTVEDHRLDHFLASWDAEVYFQTGAEPQGASGPSTARYRGGAQIFGVVGFLRGTETNPGLALFLRARVMRGFNKMVVPPSKLEPFAADARHAAITIAMFAPEATSAAADPLTFEIELVDADRLTLLSSRTISLNVFPEQTYTKAQAVAQATADKAYLHDKILPKMLAMGGVHAAVVALVTAADEPKIALRPLTRRHDSASYVAALRGPDPSRVGYFVGTTYEYTPRDSTHSFVSMPATGMWIPDLRAIAVRVTAEVNATPARLDDAELIAIIVHEAVHAMDLAMLGGLYLKLYKREFDAFYREGLCGSSDPAACSPSGASITAACAPTGCQDTAIRPNLPPPGPQSCCARKIWARIYGNYPYVKPAYDANIGGFREAVDNYHIPDGINLILSRRLESLRELIEGYSGNGFDKFHAQVQGFIGIGIGAAPSVGILTDEELHEVKRNRAWRDLVERKIRNPKHRAQIKDDLEIPR